MLTLDFDPFPVLQTERLILCKMAYTDADTVFQMRSDPQIMGDRPLARSLDDAITFIELIKDNLAERKGITWAISLREAPVMIGTIGLWRIIPEHMRAEIGYDLQPAFQGRGIMHEAMQAVIDYGFTRMHLHSIEANVNPDNTPSIRLLERNKFVKEAHFKENWYHNGKFLDSAIYSLLRSDI